MNNFVKRVSQKIAKLTDEQVEVLIEAMGEENSTLDSILESLSEGLVIVDEDWHLWKTNKAAERFLPFKIRPSDYVTEDGHIWEIIDDEEIYNFLKDCAEKQRTNVSEEFSLESTDSKVRFVTVTVLPLVQKIKNEETNSTETTILGSIISVHDITEKRTQEVLLRRMENLASLTNLAASVAHEIKNPLGAISIHIQLLQKAVKKAREGEGNLPPEKFMENYLNVINEEIDNLNKIVLDFLFAVRPVQASLKLCDPDKLLEKFSKFFKAEFDEKNISLKMNLCNKGERLLMDEKLFREVIVNLTQNSIAAIESRFTKNNDAGSFIHEEDEKTSAKKIIISPEENEKNKTEDKAESGQLIIESVIKNDRYYLTIADNGCGMDEKTLSRIFEPYYTTKANGTGLGMTMVYKIIKEFQGDIDVKSVEGHGTVFTIMISVPQKTTKSLTAGNKDKKEGEQ